MLKRYSYLVAILAMAAILAACGGSEGAEPGTVGDQTDATGSTDGAGEDSQVETVSFTIVPVSPSPLAWSFFYVPQALGWYEEEGLNVEIVGQIPRGTQTGQLAVERVDAAHVSIGEIIEYGSEHEDLVWIGVPDGYNLNLYVAADSSVAASQDLAGSTIGTREVGDDVLVQSLLGIGGVDPTEFETLPTGGGRGALAEALETGQVDAIFGSPIDASAIEEAGVRLKTVDTGASYAWPNAGITIRRSELESSSEAYARLGRAIAKGQVWTQMNAESTIDLLGEIAPESVQDPEAALEIRNILNEVNEESYNNRWDADLDVLQDFIDVQANIGVVEEAYSASQLFDSSLLDQIWSFDVARLEELARNDQRDDVFGLNN